MKFSYESNEHLANLISLDLELFLKLGGKKMLGILYVKDITGLLTMSKTILPRVVTTGAVRESY